MAQKARAANTGFRNHGSTYRDGILRSLVMDFKVNAHAFLKLWARDRNLRSEENGKVNHGRKGAHSTSFYAAKRAIKRSASAQKPESE